jgi:hypothetical protein
MPSLNARRPRKTFRGTWDEILAHSDEITRTSEVELRVFGPKATSDRQTATMALMRSWLEEDATDDPQEIQAAEEELQTFKRNMNLPRKEAGARLLYPEAE